jgi:hypothetical protein
MRRSISSRSARSSAAVTGAAATRLDRFTPDLA